MRIDLGRERLSPQSPRVVVEEAMSGSSRALEVLFIMRSLAHLRHFRELLELLVERGHNVRLLLERGPQKKSYGEAAGLWLERMLRLPNFTCDVVDHFGDRHSARSGSLRRGMEYVRFLGSTQASYVPKRFAHSPKSMRRLAARPLIRTPLGLRVLYRTLSVIERVLPAPAAAVDYVERLRPDVVALCESGSSGSLFSTYVKAAKERGIPVAICVASWDNLTSKQRMRVVPHKLIVWNETQVREAGEFHGIPADRVAVCGAPGFDEWFSWESRARGEFLARVGLDPAKPVILWVGGALNPSERTEAEYAAAWLAALRSSSDPLLREAGVLLRPHPYRGSEWLAVDFSEFDNAAVWPRELGMPVGREEKADYYDSIFHSRAVVGLNTSAMIEASIIGRPVLTILEPEFHGSQLGTFHFGYLLESSGGAVRVSHSMEENFAELGAILAGREGETSERARRFVADFVRPHGLDRPATPIVVETLERLAEASLRPERDPLWAIVARAPVVLLEPFFTRPHARLKPAWRWLRRTRTVRVSSKRIRTLWKRIRRLWKRLWKQIRRFFLVWLRAAVRNRLRRLRGQRDAVAPEEDTPPAPEP